MKKFLTLTLLMVFLFSFPSISSANSKTWKDYVFISHAMGEIQGSTYTNSLDAFEYNYKLGKRVFEVDFEFSSDGYVVARHDWSKSFYQHLNQNVPEFDGTAMTLSEFKHTLINKKFTSLSFYDVLELMKKYPDIYIVTDTKDTQKKEVIKKFKEIIKEVNGDSDILDRIIPQLYTQEMYSYVEEVYPFKSYIYTLYQSKDSDEQVVEFVNKTPKIEAITMHYTRASSDFIKRLSDLGVKSYIHTINDYNQMLEFEKMGAFGFYTDIMTEIGYNQRRLEQIRDSVQ